MDDDVLDDHRHTDAESFGEWIEQVAESRGVSEDELLHQLMSSYWMMDELAAVIDDLEIETGRGIGEGEGRTGSRSSTGDAAPARDRSSGEESVPEGGQRDRHPAAEAGEYDDGVIPLIETLKDWKSEREPRESSSVDENLIDLIKVIQEGNQQAQERPAEAAARGSESSDVETGGVNDTVQLIRALKEFNDGSGGANLQEQLAAEQKHRELAERIDTLETAVDETTEELTEIDQASQQRTREVVQQLQQFDTRLDGIEAELDAAPDAGTIDKLEDSLDDLADEITTIRGEMDARFEEVDNDFENVEQILSHLFDQTEEQSSKTEVVSEQLSKMESRVEVLDDLEAAMDLQREANRAGVTTASCESCEETVQIGQLTDASCPFCSTEFDGLEENKKWGIFSEHVLTEAGPESRA